MPLSADQRALLQLIAVRGKGPDEITPILGVDRDELDRRLAEAVRSLSPGGPAVDGDIALVVLGQADPLARADAASRIAADPELGEWVDDAREALSKEFPEGAETARSGSKPGSDSGAVAPASSSQAIPEPGTSEVKAAKALPSDQKSSAEARPGMDPRQKRLLSILVSAAGLVAIVVAVVLLLGGADSGSTEDPGPTEARLSPVPGEDGGGVVEFGFAGASFAANVSLTGLQPSGGGEGYALWLDGPVGAFPFDRAKAGQQGVVAGQSNINQAIICFIAADLFTEVKLSRAPDERFRSALREAVSARGGARPFPDFVGKTVLSGPIVMPSETRETLVRECGGRPGEGGSQGS